MRWWVTSKTTQNNLMPMDISSPSVWAGLPDLLLGKRILQTWRDVTSETKL